MECFLHRSQTILTDFSEQGAKLIYPNFYKMAFLTTGLWKYDILFNGCTENNCFNSIFVIKYWLYIKCIII